MTWLFALLVLALLWLITRVLRGDDHRQYDDPRPTSMADQPCDPQQLQAATERIEDLLATAQGTSRARRLMLLRRHMDELGDDTDFSGEIVAVDEDGTRGEWLVPPEADPTRRLLYVHGGAFMMGSPRSHRPITTRLALLLGGPLFALDYRLMPEYRRSQGIDDCRTAYRWILDRGPDGPQSLERLFLAGDSAGGNLVLMLSAWARDQDLRLPDGVIALSPVTDSTFGSPSLKSNLASDCMLGPEFGVLTRIPRSLLLWMTWVNNRAAPSSATISPLQGDLSGLPPTLLQASLDEMLLDDSVRYANKARAQGSPVQLQAWPQVPHVWHMFERELPQAGEAFARIDRFLAQPGG